MRLFIPMLALNLLLAGMLPASAGQTVTVDNFVRAETDRTLARYVEQGAFGRFVHIRQPTPIDAQDVIRMNGFRMPPYEAFHVRLEGVQRRRHGGDGDSEYSTG